jgi:hypothetical protein
VRFHPITTAIEFNRSAVLYVLSNRHRKSLRND